MIAGSNAIKSTAKTALKNHWLTAIFSSLLFLLAYLICNILSSLFSLALGNTFATISFIIMCIFIISPLFLGLLRSYWRILFSTADNPISIFYYFSSKTNYLRCLNLIFPLVFRFFAWGIFLLIPSVLVTAFSEGFFFEIFDASIPLWTANMHNFSVFLKVFAVVLLIIIMLKYYMAPILFVSNEEIDPSEAIHMSTVISKKTSVDFIYNLFSFFGWFLACLFVLPIVFILPYLLTSYAVHVRFAVAEYTLHINSQKNSSQIHANLI